VLLGTGNPNADPDRSGPCAAVVVNDAAYLVDFGPGVVRRAAAAHRAGVRALAVQNLDIAFLTHLHSDHTAGYPDLILTPWVLGRDRPLRVFGPPGLRDTTDHILAAYREDIRERIEGLEPANRTGHQLVVAEIAPGVVYRDENVSVEAFPARHGSWPAFGYKFNAAGRTIVISGDTAPHAAMIAHYADCDILLHEVYSWAGFQKRPKPWQTYHGQMHTSARELAAIAAKTQPELLVLYHQLLWGESEKSLLREIGEGYSGRVVSGKDLDVF
jgi:ribonuclease BN (tRNA processing enzyme)